MRALCLRRAPKEVVAPTDVGTFAAAEHEWHSTMRGLLAGPTLEPLRSLPVGMSLTRCRASAYRARRRGRPTAVGCRLDNVQRFRLSKPQSRLRAASARWQLVVHDGGDFIFSALSYLRRKGQRSAYILNLSGAPLWGPDHLAIHN